jgi:hypothetical protein
MTVKNETKISASDAALAIKLHEEIQAQTYELGLIVGRTLGFAGKPITFTYGPENAHEHPAPIGPTADSLLGNLVQLVDCYQYSDGTCGCLDYVKMVCYEC